MEMKEATKEAKQAKPFISKSFYLDLTGFSEIKTLSEDILLLGGTLEQFLSKDVGCVITNGQPRKRAKGNPRCLSATPETSGSKTSAKESANSQVVSRGIEILKKAAKVSSGNCNVLDNAEKWGLEIINLPEMLALIEKYKTKHALRKQMCKKEADFRSQQVRVLRKCFIKFEAVNKRSRPVHIEFSSWPVSVFTSDKYLVLRSAKSRRKSTEVTLAAANTTKSKKKFCEICSTNFHGMQTHVTSEQHRRSLNGNNRYLAFDTLMNDGYNLDSYLKKLHSDYPNFNEISDVEMANHVPDLSASSFEEKVLNESSLIAASDNHQTEFTSVCYANQALNLSTRKRSFEFSDSNSCCNKKNKLDLNQVLSHEQIVNELVCELCLTVSLFDPGIESIFHNVTINHNFDE